MVDASNPTLKDSKGLEISDSPGPKVVHNDFAESWDQPLFMNPSKGSDSVGAILLQKDPKTLLMRPVYFVSRVMKPTEKAYSPVEKMVLALMFATQRFRAYILP